MANCIISRDLILNPLTVKLYFLFCVGNMILLSSSIADSPAEEKNLHMSESEKSIMIYKVLFEKKRAQQIEAVDAMMSFKYEQKYSLLLKMLEKAFEVLSFNKVFLEEIGYIPGYTELKNDTLKEALFQVLDTTTMYSEFQLKLPDVTDRIMMKNPHWFLLAKWGIGFSNSTGLFDVKTTKLINLVAQELNLIERSPTFVNPYRTPSNIQSSTSSSPPTQKVKAKKKKKFERGPRITKSRHTEL